LDEQYLPALLRLKCSACGAAVLVETVASQHVTVSVEAAVVVSHVVPAQVVVATSDFAAYPIGHVTATAPAPSPSASPQVAFALQHPASSEIASCVYPLGQRISCGAISHNGDDMLDEFPLLCEL
jgi:hypothetical protein